MPYWGHNFLMDIASVIIFWGVTAFSSTFIALRHILSQLFIKLHFTILIFMFYIWTGFQV